MINYELIGTVPEAEQFRDTLPLMLTAYIEKMDQLNEHSPRKERLKLSLLASQIEDCAKHFYGFDPEDFDTMDQLIDAIQGMDQHLEF